MNHWVGQIQPKSNWLFSLVNKAKSKLHPTGYSIECKKLTNAKELDKRWIVIIYIHLIYVNSGEYTQTIQLGVLFGEMWMEK